MENKIPISGIASFNGITYQSNHYKVAVKNVNDQLQIKISEMNKRKYFDKYYKIPFVRGVVSLIDVMTMTKFNTVWFVTAILFILYSSIKVNDISYMKYTSYITFGLLIISLLVIKFIIGRYHGAEHKAFNTYQNNKELTIENIKNESRITTSCGSYLVIFLLFIYLIIILIFPQMNMLLGFIIAWDLAYEIIKGDYKIFPITQLGIFLQYYFFTSEPTEKEMEVARVALTTLIEKELEVIK